MSDKVNPQDGRTNYRARCMDHGITWSTSEPMHCPECQHLHVMRTSPPMFATAEKHNCPDREAPDREVSAISDCLLTLAPLDADARDRIVGYLYDRFSQDPEPTAKQETKGFLGLGRDGCAPLINR